MATHLSSITGIGSSAKKLAALLQKKAPPGEKLAFINDREAALLKRHGGSGKEVEDTGIKSYDDGEGISMGDSGSTSMAAGSTTPTSEQISGFGQDLAGKGIDYGGVSNEPVGGGVNLSEIPITATSRQTASAADVRPGSIPTNIFSTPQYAGAPAAQYQAAGPVGIDQNAPQQDFRKSEILAENAAQPQQPAQPKTGLFGDAAKTLGLTSDQLGRGLGGGLQTLLAANQMRQARAQGQQTKQELMAQAAPYQQQGQQLTAQANAGTLTPANQQALQAAQAQMAQQVQARGGVGAAQMQTQIAQLTNNLLQQQMNMGLQLQQVGDKIAQGAIQAGAQADQYVNQLTASYAQNIARTVFNTPYVVGGSNP